MKIEKKKVTEKTKLSTAVKSSIATALGMASTLSLSACFGEAESGDPIGPIEDPEPTCGEAECAPESSNSSVLDIPSSQEAISSSALEALSSAAKLSSSSIEPPISSGVPHIYSTPLEESSRSSDEVAPNSSSSETQSSNSRPKVEIIPVEPDTFYQKKIIGPDNRCEPNSPDCHRINLCKDPDGCIIYSMVTTFEQGDIQA